MTSGPSRDHAGAHNARTTSRPRRDRCKERLTRGPEGSRYFVVGRGAGGGIFSHGVAAMPFKS